MIRRAEFSTAVREQALLRATYCCERCGRRAPVLEVHHRGHRADRSLFNAEVLCVACHTAEHKKRTAAAGSAQRAAARAQGIA
jgi:5-methylcytosine-specific restriction endonuclease McrA